MEDFIVSNTAQGLSVKLWRGERMILIGMDVDQPEDDFVGFAIEEKLPGENSFKPLRNRLAFSYGAQAATTAVNGYRNFPSTEAPFQKFRWVQFPYDPVKGEYSYRVTKMHMPQDDSLQPGISLTLSISIDVVVYNDFLKIGFARNFASSQAYSERFNNNAAVIPGKPADGLSFEKVAGDVYEWLGFEAYQLIFDFLEEVAADESLTLDFFAYDLNEPDVVGALETLGPRLRAIIDDSADHAAADSAESQASGRLAASAGEDHVQRMHFKNLQHNKVLLAKKDGQPWKVLFGSTNFSFRGIYIQANNVVVFHSPEVAALFERSFELAFTDPGSFPRDPVSQQWHSVELDGKPPLQFCFSPHTDTDLSLKPVGDAIKGAQSSVLFSIAFLNQIHSGPVHDAIEGLETNEIFSYGISNSASGLNVSKPDGSTGIVDFNYLHTHTPAPFNVEWSGGAGIHEHHKFVVVDFNLPTAKVFTGSSNLSPSGEKSNGDNLMMIEDQKVATSYAIEALRIFDHLHFRSRLEKAKAPAGAHGHAAAGGDTLTLQKPTAISGKPAWFEKFYVVGSVAENDRKLFAH